MRLKTGLIKKDYSRITHDPNGQCRLFAPPSALIITPGARNRINAPSPKGRARAASLALFEAAPSATFSPAQEARQQRRRALSKARQRRHRAKKKMALFAEVARYTGLEEQNEAAAAYVFQVEREREEWQGAQWLEYIRALGVLWGALTLNHTLAARVFAQVEPASLGPTHGLVFEAARRIHERGAPVTRVALEREVKKLGVTLLHPLKWLDSAVRSPHFPTEITLELIDQNARIVKQA